MRLPVPCIIVIYRGSGRLKFIDANDANVQSGKYWTAAANRPTAHASTGGDPALKAMARFLKKTAACWRT
jgi:hypothetical protein